MAFPSLGDIISSVQDVRFIRDPFFEKNTITLMGNGKPYMFGGGFSQVFQIKKDDSLWAFKVWKQDNHQSQARIQAIKSYLTTINLPYFLDFNYVEHGLLVNGQLIPILRMPWAEGVLLKYYINQHVDNAGIINALAEQFLQMTKTLHQNAISHGDLKNDNIFITVEGNIILIDYDAICVPELENQSDFCAGTEGYQHPFRELLSHFASTKVDYFSELIIYLSIRAVGESPLLWQKYAVMAADYRLLFTRQDLWDFKNSPIKNDLMMLSLEIQELTIKLENYIYAHLNLIPL